MVLLSLKHIAISGMGLLENASIYSKYEVNDIFNVSNTSLFVEDNVMETCLLWFDFCRQVDHLTGKAFNIMYDI